MEGNTPPVTRHECDPLSVCVGMHMGVLDLSELRLFVSFELGFVLVVAVVVSQLLFKLLHRRFFICKQQPITRQDRNTKNDTLSRRCYLN